MTVCCVFREGSVSPQWWGCVHHPGSQHSPVRLWTLWTGVTGEGLIDLLSGWLIDLLVNWLHIEQMKQMMSKILQLPNNDYNLNKDLEKTWNSKQCKVHLNDSQSVLKKLWEDQ